MEKQIINIKTRNQLILQFAYNNANEDCWKIMELLPNKNPSLDKMIDACAKVGSDSHNMSLQADSIADPVKVTPHCYNVDNKATWKRSVLTTAF